MNRRIEIEGKDPNFSVKLIVPMLEIKPDKLKELGNFINSYITNEYEIVLVFNRNKENPRSINFLEYMKGSNYFKTEIIDEDEISLVFCIDIEDHINIDSFKVGRYSEFTQRHKDKIEEFVGKTSIKDNYTATAYNIIYPQDFKRRQIAERLFDDKDINQGVKLINEVLDRPDLDREIYKTIQQLQQDKQTKQLLDKL